jgi:hypothetical protein
MSKSGFKFVDKIIDEASYEESLKFFGTFWLGVFEGQGGMFDLS